LPGRVIQKIGTAYDVGDALRGVIHSHGKHVGIDLIAALQNKIADRIRHILSIRTLNAIGEKHVPGLDPQADCCRRACAKLTSAASSGIAQLIFQLRPAASAGKGSLLCVQGAERLFVKLGAIILASNRSVPFEAELLQRAQNPIRRSSDLSGTIEILNAQQPTAAMRAGIQEACDRRVE
jgi:hypothetical protein